MKLFVFPLLLFLLNTCGHSNQQKQAVLNQEFQLGFKESVFVQSEKSRIGFRSLIQDSRCPKSVKCIAAGKAVVELEFVTGEESTTVQLSTEGESSEIEIGEYKIKLVAVDPYPVSPGQKDPKEYSVRLLLSKD